MTSYVATIFPFILLFFAWSTCTANSLTAVEEQLQRLTEKYNEIQVALANKDTSSKLEDKVVQLEVKVSLLEQKVTQQESVLIDLQDKLSSKLTKTDTQQNVELANLPSARKNFFRTCQQIYDYDSELISDWHWIDPDGQDIGDDPIYVYCDVTDDQVTTSVPHDSESKIEKEHCSGAGCYSRKINYNATMGQMMALVELSNECHQSFTYDCIDAPFEWDDEQYSWWSDKNDDPQYFWAGSIPVHQCQCKIDGNLCVNPDKNCNCDARMLTSQTDSGIIWATELLPVTKLNFGLASGSGQHTLGRFECTGKVTVDGIPTSCADLWHIGHTLKGTYSVKGVQERIETVYCDFTKLPSDPSIQTFIGYTDVKSSPVYFYAEKTLPDKLGDIITYEFKRVDEGNAMDHLLGKFTAPRAGIYSFAFSTSAYMLVTIGGNYRVSLKRSVATGASIEIGHGISDFSKGSPSYHTLSINSILCLNEGDKIWIEKDGIPTRASLNDSPFIHYTHFTGMLLEEYNCVAEEPPS